jgi:hypothetical protein
MDEFCRSVPQDHKHETSDDPNRHNTFTGIPQRCTLLRHQTFEIVGQNPQDKSEYQ